MTDGGNISGSTNTTLTLSTTTTNDGGSYSVVIKNNYGNVTNSSTAKLTIIFSFTLITFDDLPDSTGNFGLAMPASYDSLNWSGFYVLDGVNYIGNPSGYQAGVVSQSNVVWSAGSIGRITNNTPFNFLSAYLTAAWYDNLQLQVEGFAGSVLTYSNTYTLSATTPALINFNYAGVTEVYFNSFGGTQHVAYSNGSGEHFAMDNVTVSTNMVTVTGFPPKFQTMSATGGNFQFSWNTVNTYPVVGYQVQYTTNLARANWINLGGVLTGSTPTLSASDTISTNTQRFYRVLLVQ